MRYLFDTQIVIWAAHGSARLPKLARELIEEDDQPDLLLAAERIEVPVDRRGPRKVRAEGLADMGVGLVGLAKPDPGSVVGALVGRRLEVAEPVAVDVPEDGLKRGLLG